MKKFALALTVAMLPVLATAAGDEIWKWTDANGTVHYSNRAQFAPEGATTVESRITMQVDQIPADHDGRATNVASNFDAYDPFPAKPEIRHPKLDRRWRVPITEQDRYQRLPFDGGNEHTRAPYPAPLYDSFGEHLAESRYPGAVRFEPLPDAPRIYDEPRLKFGCYTANVLWSGGFSQPNDISGTLNCYPYLLGPRAWLNAARSELAMRENGINPRDMMKLYVEGY